MIIDGHIHTFTAARGVRLGEELITSERYGKVRRQGRGLERWMPPSFENSNFPVEMLVEYLDWAGVEKGILLQSTVYGDHNEYYSEIIKRYPGRFAGFALVDPRGGERSLDRLEYVVKKLGLIPDIPIDLRESSYKPFWQKVVDLDAFLGIDLGWEPESSYYFQLEQLRLILQSYPNLKLLLTHTGLGGRSFSTLAEDTLNNILELTKTGNNTMFDLAGFPLLCNDEEYPFPSAQKIVGKICEKVGSERIIWGSDIPQILKKCTYKQCLRWIKDCDYLTERDKKRILGENAEEFYRL